MIDESSVCNKERGCLTGSSVLYHSLSPAIRTLSSLLSIQAGETGGRRLGKYRAEAHEALAAPLYVLALPLMAVAFVIGAGFRRQGFVGRIILTTGAAVALRLLGLALKAATSNEPTLWPIMYLPPLVGMAVALWLLAGWPVPWRRRANGKNGRNDNGSGNLSGKAI